MGGLVLYLTILGIPLGLEAIKLGTATLTSFKQEVMEDSNPNSLLEIVCKVAQLFFFDWRIVLVYLFRAVLLAMAIIGLPFAIPPIELISLALLPLGKI